MYFLHILCLKIVTGEWLKNDQKDFLACPIKDSKSAIHSLSFSGVVIAA